MRYLFGFFKPISPRHQHPPSSQPNELKDHHRLQGKLDSYTQDSKFALSGNSFISK